MLTNAPKSIVYFCIRWCKCVRCRHIRPFNHSFHQKKKPSFVFISVKCWSANKTFLFHHCVSLVDRHSFQSTTHRIEQCQCRRRKANNLLFPHNQLHCRHCAPTESLRHKNSDIDSKIANKKFLSNRRTSSHGSLQLVEHTRTLTHHSDYIFFFLSLFVILRQLPVGVKCGVGVYTQFPFAARIHTKKNGARENGTIHKIALNPTSGERQ